MGALFGTDGVRGIANIELTPEMAFDLGRAGSFVLARQQGESRPRIMVGRDTRVSGDMLEAALIAGICATGADVLTLGIIPTPAVAYLTQQYQASCGIVISASHNPVQDNGIKFFGSNGYKLPDEIEDEIEKLVLKGTQDLPRPQGDEVGRVYHVEEALNRYISFIENCYGEKSDLSNLTIVVDCANGASYQAAPRLWRRLGARIVPINDQPNGININDRCGSTYTEGLKRAVIEYKADLGIAYDGDADRCIAVDERGNELDGDYIMAICALDMQRQGRMNQAGIVATVMSNIGLDIALRRENVPIHYCKVGDRYVLEKMMETGALLGGEQSGHIIFREYATTGDGLLSSLKLVEVMQRTGLALSELSQEMEKFPQILVNVRIDEKESVLAHSLVLEAIQAAEERLGEWGKLVVRPSGTEPLLRIMAQGPEHHILEEVVGEICSAIEQVQTS
ncbi:MAG TPA: phosphoglucosamine mutase [Syntrophomonadaceae bacterium]|nr:phosphoglucosamine mutase [Syntrophomonadaceae bacterium]